MPNLPGLLLLALIAAPGFPPYVPLVGVEAPQPGSLTVEDFGEATFPLAADRSVTKQGRHYRSYVSFPGGVNPGAEAAWKRWLPALSQKGFRVAGSDGATSYTLQRVEAGLESWLFVSLGDYSDPLLELVEVKAQDAALSLPPPAAQPEPVGDGQDFPYLSHPPGSSLRQTVRHAEPLDVTVPGVDPEPALVGNGHVVKRYASPSGLSRLQFAQLYRDALTRAGWTVKPASPGARVGEGPLVASYARSGRQLWAVLTCGEPGTDRGVELAVADVGAEDWAGALERDCRLPLHGVPFDSARATRRPDSTPVLERVLALLRSRADLILEVQGHTDDVGGDLDNQRHSDARAQAVLRWLVDHGVDAARLSAHGYGRKVPLAPNVDDASRARNRRVELHRKACGA